MRDREKSRNCPSTLLCYCHTTVLLCSLCLPSSLLCYCHTTVLFCSPLSFHHLCCVTVTQLSYSVPLCPSIISRVTVTQLPACVLLFKVCHAVEMNHSTDLEIQYSPGIFSFSHYHCGHTGMEASLPCQITSGVCVQLPCQHL